MNVIGLMSGTSADGVDVAIYKIVGDPGNMRVEFIAGKTYSYDRTMRQRILDSCDIEKSRVDEIAQLNVDLAEIFADSTLDLIDALDMTPEDIDLIGSHGQTLWHNVLPNGQVSASFQIVEASVIAERTGITTVNNMRARDVAVGGQGAPLTSYIDWLLLRHSDHWRAIQNIGGMGNVTFLPPLSDTRTQPVSFDTGPGNALLDVAVGQFTDGQQTYDRDGRLARQGRIDEVWLDDLLQHPYYQRDYPKTTGREMFGTEAAQRLIKEAHARGLNDYEIIATLTALTATNIADAYQRFAPAQIKEVILGGGGRHNPVMIEMLAELVSPAMVITHEDIGIDSDFKESLVFAVLAYETWHGRVGALPCFTGAHRATVLGQITPGNNYLRLIQALASTLDEI